MAIRRLMAELGTVERSEGTAGQFLVESSFFNIEKHEITAWSGSHQLVVPSCVLKLSSLVECTYLVSRVQSTRPTSNTPINIIDTLADWPITLPEIYDF